MSQGHRGPLFSVNNIAGLSLVTVVNKSSDGKAWEERHSQLLWWCNIHYQQEKERKCVSKPKTSIGSVCSQHSDRAAI